MRIANPQLGPSDGTSEGADVTLTGVQIPNKAEVYDPVLDELETQGIVFEEREVEPSFY